MKEKSKAKHLCIFHTRIILIQFNGCLLCFYTFWFACLISDIGDSWHDRHKWKNRLIDHVLFTCNWFIVLRKWAHMGMLLQKSCFENISKFHQLLATAMESISRKRSFLQLVNAFWERTLQHLFFYITTNWFKKLKVSSLWK